MSIVDQAINALNNAVSPFRNNITDYERILDDIRQLPGLSVGRVTEASFVSEKSSILIKCDVLIPFKGRNYPTPLRIFFPFNYPTVGPIFVLKIPNPATQSVRPNHACVAEDGRVHMTGLTNWTDQSQFSALFAQMRFEFERDYPIRQVPSSQDPQREPPRNPLEDTLTDPLEKCWEDYTKISDIENDKQFLVQNKRTNQQFIAKVVEYKNTKNDKKARGEIIHSMLSIVHPNVVRCYNTYVGLDKMVLILEHCEKGTLRRYIDVRKEKKDYFKNDEILKAVVEYGRGLKLIHDKMVIHRDLRPEVLMIGGDWVYKISDFQSSIQLSDAKGKAEAETSSGTETHTLMGVPEYSAQEILHEQPYSFPVDIYSFGIVLFEMMALLHPYKKVNPKNNKERLESSRFMDGKPPNELDPRDYNPGLLEMVKAMISTDPVRRPTIGDILGRDFVLDYIQKTHL